ncbi:MAG: F0F1 ATP synthase subunit B' [Rhodospirillaceae bacterium]
MPQIDQMDTYLSQAFWLVVTFGFLYLVLWKAALPRVSTILMERQSRIDEDLHKAEELKKEADEAMAAYEKLAADARSQVQALLREANEQLASESAARHEALSDRIKADVAAAEARIDAARAAAVASIQAVAVEVAQAATSRLIGTDVTADDAKAAVAAAVEGRN